MRIAVLTLLLAGAALAGESKFGALELAAEPQSLLEGRMEVRMPAGARIEARQQGIMAAPEAGQRETRVMLDAGPQRMVLMTYELFASAGQAFEAAVKKDAPPGSKVEAFAPAELLKGWKLETAKLDPADEAAEVARAVLADADGHVMVAAIYVNPPASSEDEAGSRALAARVLASLRPGKRKLDLSAREVTLEPLPGNKSLRIQLPAGWVHYSQAGEDFVVHHLQAVVALGETPPRAGLYLGGHPAWMHERRKAEVETRAVTLLGTETEWKRWKPDPQVVTLEAMVPVPEERIGHAFLTAPPERLDEARRLLESLRIVP